MKLFKYTKTWTSPSQDIFFWPEDETEFPGRRDDLESIRAHLFGSPGYLGGERNHIFNSDGTHKLVRDYFWLSKEARDKAEAAIQPAIDKKRSQDDIWQNRHGVTEVEVIEEVNYEDLTPNQKEHVDYYLAIQHAFE